MPDNLKPSAKSRGRGRPSSYRPEFAKQAENYCNLGATDYELAVFFGISTQTIKKWQFLHDDFAKALKNGKAALDERVERSLCHRALGYTYEGEKVFQSGGEIIRAKTIEHVPPDTTACIFWLKNRRPAEWRDVHRHEVGRPGQFAALADIPDADLAKVAAGEMTIRIGTTAPHPNGGNGKAN